MKSEGKVQYEIVRSSRRRRLALRITDDAKIVVCAPNRISIRTIEQFVSSHKPWIEQKTKELQQLPKALSAHTYEDGDTFLYLDELLSLQIVRKITKKTTCMKVDGYLIVTAPSSATKNAIKKAIVTWYRNSGIQLYEKLVAKWIGEIGYARFAQPIFVDMAHFPKRWGSCSHKGQLRFALRSLLLPIALVDYLALHEVGHLLHFNHGAAYKRLLDTHMPDWRERQQAMNRLRLRTATL